MVGIGHAPGRDLPGLFPLQAFLVDENAHELGYRDGRMRIIHLEDIVAREVLVVRSALSVFPDANRILQTRRRKEILLPESQHLAALAGVVRIENHGDVLGIVLRRHRLGVGTGIEFIEVELVGCRCLPQPQGIHRPVAIAGDRQVIGNGEDIIRIDPAHPVSALLVLVDLGMPAEMDALRILRPLEFPGVAVAQPVIRLLDLPAVPDFLPEHAVLITDSVADDRKLQCCATVDKAGGETSETAVAEAGIRFVLHNLFGIKEHVVQCTLDLGLQSHVQNVIAERPPDQELERHVIGSSNTGFLVLDPGIAPVGDQPVPQRVGHGGVHVVG